MIYQLGAAMGLDLGAVAATPEQVWAGLLDEVERRFKYVPTPWHEHGEHGPKP